MTASPDELGEDGPDPMDPLDALLRPPIGLLPTPPGSFGRIRRRAARRRRTRAAAGGCVALAALAGVFYLGGAFTQAAPTRVVTPPVASTQFSPVPSVTGPATGAPSPVPSRTPTGAGPTSSAVAGGSVSAAPAGSGATGAGVPVAPTPTASTPMCATSQLTAALGGGDAGAGNVYRYLVLTNHSATACHVTGFPGLSMLDADGRQIGDPATYESFGYSPVVLQPGSSASGTIRTANRQTGSSTECLPTSVELRVYPPGNKDPLEFAGQVTDCDQLFSVTPFAAGSSGNPPS